MKADLSGKIFSYSLLLLSLSAEISFSKESAQKQKLSLAGEATGSAAAGPKTFTHCELKKIRIVEGSTGLRAAMRCFDRSKGPIKKWTTSPSYYYPSSINKGTSCQQVQTLNETIQNLNEHLKNAYGYCDIKPYSVPVEVGGIEQNQSFFYMAFKKDIVLKKVVIDGNNLVSADLVLSKRFDVSFDSAPMAPPMSYAMKSQANDLGTIFKSFGGFGLTEKDSKGSKDSKDSMPIADYFPDKGNQVKSNGCDPSEIDMLNEQIANMNQDKAYYEDERRKCSDTSQQPNTFEEEEEEE
ncbi:MAG: hypothetical protein KA436_08300 [Oligoflexales bacterium]|nr:hypothetical protein [Oligoflexales bacterium]